MNRPEGRPAYGRISMRRNCDYRRFWRIRLNGVAFDPAGWTGWALHLKADPQDDDAVIELSQAVAAGAAGVWPVPASQPNGPGFDVTIPESVIDAVDWGEITTDGQGVAHLYWDLRGIKPGGGSDVPLEGVADVAIGITGA